MATLVENLSTLPSIDDIVRIELSCDGKSLGEIPNAEGKRGSLKIYSHLVGGQDGVIDRARATQGLELFAEYVDKARAKPGEHPNIDYLLNYGSPINVKVYRS